MRNIFEHPPAHDQSQQYPRSESSDLDVNIVLCTVRMSRVTAATSATQASQKVLQSAPRASKRVSACSQGRETPRDLAFASLQISIEASSWQIALRFLRELGRKSQICCARLRWVSYLTLDITTETAEKSAFASMYFASENCSTILGAGHVRSEDEFFFRSISLL